MPNPRKKHTKNKRGQRRSHDALTRPGTSVCSRCGEAKRPHHVCPSCGYYRGRSVVKKEEEI